MRHDSNGTPGRTSFQHRSIYQEFFRYQQRHAATRSVQEQALRATHNGDVPELIELGDITKRGLAIQALTQRRRHRRRAVSHVQLAIDPAHVTFDGLLAHHQLGGDSPVGRAGHHQGQHFALPLGQA
jgi:hypothetical protein